MIELTKEYIEKFQNIIAERDDEKAKEELRGLYPADIAELYKELDLDEAIYLYLLMDDEKAADVLMELDEEDRHKLLKELPNELIAKRFVDNMETDDAVDLMRELDEDTQEEILSHIQDVEQAGDIVDLLKYDEDTAGGLMGTEMIVVNENWSMPKCIDEMRKQAEEMDEIYYVYVVDDDERLRGVLPLKKLITNPSVSKIKHVMKKDPISVRDSDSIEEVTETIEKYDLVALPVVDSIGRLVGRITIDDVMDEVREQHERDYQLASGISQDVETSDNVFTQTAARLPWLLIGMLGGLGNSVILGGFETSFATNPKMALFIPLIVVNCIVLGRAEAFAAKNGVIPSFFDGVGIGLGFTIGLTCLGAVRELFGTGKLFGMTLMPEEFGSLVFVLAPGGFIALGYLIAIVNKLKKA